MSDEELDRMVHDADPYRTDLIERLGGAEQTLLEEIMSTPVLVPVPKKGFARRFAGAVAAAAVVTGVIGATTLLGDRGRENPAPSTALPSAHSGDYQFDLMAAEKLPRLLIGEPGWKITTVYGFAAQTGTIEFVDGNRQIEMNWYPEERYRSFYDKRARDGKPSATTVAGTPAHILSYGASEFGVLVQPRDGAYVEIRTGSGWTRAGVEALLKKVERVDAAAFLAAMPPEVVTPSEVREQVRKVLTDVPIPPGFDVAAVRVDGANDAYQFGAEVTGRVTCAWIGEWIRADKAGDAAATGRAAEALRSSTRWRVLEEMEAQGAWPKVLREVAAQVASGDVDNGYQGALGCDSPNR
ncbi:hypothetical protein [Actinoplanes utahensis]|uniref:Uncharacterized protein n=1 Tax=Actinoplanes utahensis TaxID=1869 RepID=A0A0A6UUU1_ACTUT|nr:hypothetical protein [Actinoplanes utahensis]KHD78214.1 hypothetical protein MB27_07175 [Actinoplanes utahensis]GIF30736.1 hypothetical protein Aut01nite_37220 [Actinoplanes utahensis]